MHDVIGADVFGGKWRERVLNVEVDVGGKPVTGWILRGREVEAIYSGRGR